LNIIELKSKKWILVLSLVALVKIQYGCGSVKPERTVPESIMQDVFNEVKTPYKFGIIFRHPDSTKLMDSPSIFRWNDTWYMTYIIFDGKGYETWLAESKDLLEWKSNGRILSFTGAGWDSNQKAGYMALLDTKWEGTYQPVSFRNLFWMSYLGGSTAGYEAGQLGVGIATSENPAVAAEWNRLPEPVLSANDTSSRWFENQTIYKSTIIEDSARHTGKRFVMFYNAKGDTADYESIGMAVSDDMLNWQRFGQDPVISKFKKGTISGDAQIAQINGLYVMFYFGAFWNDAHAYERFACSYDLIHWTDWKGENLVEPSEPYDRDYAHKPFVIKWKGIVYHFYNAVGSSGRVIALATSKPLKH
jgi:predicted GH43/DUF377 family glycosyl hydrolase